MNGTELDQRIRLNAFDFLSAQVELHGEILPRSVLAEGFLFEGNRIPLVGPQGIFKPHLLELPLTITTAPIIEGQPRPYDDGFEEAGLLRYRYRGEDPNHRDNVGLREVMRRRLPLIYFHGVARGRYMPCWPAYLVHDNPANLCFSVALDDQSLSGGRIALAETDDSAARRSYVTTLVRRRMHQQTFRERVLAAYREHCAVCRLRHYELLEAAHILPDTHERGEPVVSNGLALCSLHHAAFDRHILGIRPDLIIEIREDILEETDGPMLIHGLQGFQDKQILVPRSPIQQPNRDFLAERYGLFRKAS
ncbi:MAG TPA: HNH endonuclease signature motif containing protein [Acidobacteriota bacterium]|nr:HNH endonuclease signature motif containing protein [Acidobacteriota bacterium]